MSGLPPGDPQLVSMIVSHLKTQGLFDQFRRDCLADVDTKPAYLNLKQRVDNFVSNHLSNHTWSPHLNKNQLRNNIRQLVLQSGMLEQGVDRIVAQVVDPKINHIFRPQVERVVREFLSPGSCSEEPPAPLPSTESRPDSSIPEQASSAAPSTAAASSAMSILDTITSLNQEASVRASSETEKEQRGQVSDEFMELVEESEQNIGGVEEGVSHLEEAEESKMTSEVQALEMKTEDTQEPMDLGKEELIGEVKIEEEESGVHEQKGDEKEKTTVKIPGKPSEEKQDDDQLKTTNQAKQKARERIKEEYSLEDSDLEGLSDITVSSVHTSDLSSFEGQSEDEEMLSDSSEEGELPPDGQDEMAEKKCATGDTGEEEECKPRRKAYVHKPFLYSRYYSDSDDEITVEERRRSAAKDKEERLLKRQQNRERMEEKRKQKAAQAEEQDHKKQRSGDSAGMEGPQAKEARKERKVLEKKMALNRKRKLDSRKEGDILSKKKGDTGGEGSKKMDLKPVTSKNPQPKLIRNLSESASSEERHRRMSGNISDDSSETKKLCDKGWTHSFILELEQGSQEALKQRTIGKFDRVSRKELHIKERKEKERSLSDERAKLKLKQEKKSEYQAEESQQKEGAKVPSEEKGEKKPRIKNEKKITGNTKEGKISSSEGVADEGPKDVKKVKTPSTEPVKAEKDKIREKEKDKCKEKEKLKGEKMSAKSDFKQLQRPDSTGSSEDRSDLEPGSDGNKKKDKHSKEILKRSKSHSEDRQVEKPKSKMDSKDVEKEKNKADQDSQKLKKATSETDKDPKRVKLTEKGVFMEKIRSKSKEETKTWLLLKTDKKVQCSEVRSVGGASTSKPEMTKEKKKEGNAKEQRKVPDELSHEKSEVKSAKKKTEKEKVPEKKDDGQEEKKEPREEKLEKSDKSSKSSVSSPSLETKEPPKKQPVLQDTSADSDPVTTTVTTSFSDDTCDALSDITPEPPEGETDSRLDEMPAFPVEADALLALMDVCASAEARLPPENLREDVSAERALHDADMKMKEAALTLLSMDPDSTVPSSLIIHNTTNEPDPNEAAPQAMETPDAQEEQHPPMDVQTAAETEFITTEASTAAPQQTTELVGDETNTADQSDNSGREMDTSEVEISETLAPQGDDAPSNECQDSLKEEENKKAEIPPETQLKNELLPPAADNDAADAAEFHSKEVRGDAEEKTVSVVSSTTDKISELPTQMSSKEVTLEQTQLDVSDTKMIPETEDVVDEENQANKDMDTSEAESKELEGENIAAEITDQQSTETNVSDKTEEVREGEFLGNISSTSDQEDKGSEISEKQEEKMEERGRRKRKLSGQKAAVVTESGDERGEKEFNDQSSAEETEQTKVVEVKTPCTGHSSRTTEEAERDQPEKLDEPLSCREQLLGATAKEATTDDQNEVEHKHEESTDKTSSGESAETDETVEEESTTKESSTPVQEDTEPAGSSDSEESRKPAVKGKMSEEMEEFVEADKEVKEVDVQQEQSEQPSQKQRRNSSSGEQEEVTEESCGKKKSDDIEEEQSQQDHESTPKRNVRRGRPSKAAVAAAAAAAAAAATEDSDKKAEEKSEQKDDDDDEEGEDGEEEKETATRATTRLASRLEAERNKPSKPSTRASRQSGKDETATGTRGARGQAATAKGGRKREASPPVVRTRGGQKSEEPPSKRAKR